MVTPPLSTEPEISGAQREPSTALAPGAWPALFLVSGASAISLLDRNIIGILAPSIKADLQVGDAEMGLLYGTVFALFYALFSLPLGRLADGWRRTWLIAICIFFWSFSTGVAAFASSFLLLAVSRLGVGIGEAAVQPAGASLVYDYFPRARRGVAIAVLSLGLTAGIGASFAVGGAAAAWWATRYASGGAPLGLAGWQFAFLVAAAPGILIAYPIWRLREPQRGAVDGIVTAGDAKPFKASLNILVSVTPGLNWLAMWRRHSAARDWAVNFGMLATIIGVAAITAYITEWFSPRPPLILGGLPINPHLFQWCSVAFGAYVVVNLLQALQRSDPPLFVAITRSPSLIMCIAVASLQNAITFGSMAFMPTYLMKRFDVPPEVAGFQFGSITIIVGIIGPLLSGFISDRLSRGNSARRVWITLTALGLAPLFGIWALSANTLSDFYIRFALSNMVLTMWMPAFFPVFYDQVLPRMRGVTTSLFIVVSTIVGLGIGPYAVGMVSDATNSIATALIAINALAPIIALLLVFLALRVERDQAGLLDRMRLAGEKV